MLIAAAMAAVVLFVIVDEPLATRALWASGAAIAAALMVPPLNRRMVKRRLRRLYEERVGAEAPVLVEVGLRSDGLWVRQGRSELTVGWEEVQGVESHDDAIEVWLQTGGLVVVRDRAFTDDVERARFVEAVRKQLHAGVA